MVAPTSTGIAVRVVALVLALTTGFALAARITVAGQFQGAPGDVVAIPIQVAGAGKLVATAPVGLTLLGIERASATSARYLATFLIGSAASAGSHTITFELKDHGAATASTSEVVAVSFKAGIAVTSTAPSTLRAGSTATFVFHIQNKGNGQDTFSLFASGDDAPSLEKDVITLESGAIESVKVSVHPTTFGDHLLDLRVRSQTDPSVKKVVEAEYQVLVFGNQNPGAPVLTYALPLGGAYGTSGVQYFGGLNLSGDLSAIVSTADRLALTPTSRSVSFGVLGSDWSALYGYSTDLGHSLGVSYGPASASAELTNQGRLTTGASYAFGRWSVSYDHTWGPLASDDLTGRYSFALGPGLTLTTGLGVRGEAHMDATYHVSPLLSAATTWLGPVVVMNGFAVVAPWSSQPWRVSLTAYSRSTSPLALNGSVSASPGSYSASLGAQQTLSNSQLQLAQSLVYSNADGANGQFGVLYDFANFPASVSAIGGVRVQQGLFTTYSSFTGTITQLPWTASANVSFDQGVTVSYGQSYIAPTYSVGGTIALPLSGTLAPVFGLTAAYAPQNFNLAAGLSYDTGDGTIAASGEVGVQVTPTFALTASVGDSSDQGFTWSIGAQATLIGGFPVPKPVITAFGGLNLGTIVGRITKKSDGGIVPASGVQVAIADLNRVTTTDEHGDFRMDVPPGSYKLTFPQLAPELVPPNDTTVVVKRQVTTRKDLQFLVSYAISGQVYVDVAGTGKPTAESYGVADASVSIASTRGATLSTSTDQNGYFTFRDLQPGTYRAHVDANSLPSDLTPASGAVEVNLASKGVAFISIGTKRIPTTVTNTLGGKNLPMSVSVDPPQAPPMALIHLTVEVEGATKVQASFEKAPSVQLKPSGKGEFQGDIEIPSNSAGVALLDVHAEGPNGQADQTTMIFVTDGPLATLSLDPGYAEAGSTVTVSAHVLVKADSVRVQVGQETVTLEPRGGRTFVGTFTAPPQATTVPVVLDVDGKELGRQILTVTVPASSGP